MTINLKDSLIRISPFSKLLGIEVDEVESGFSLCSLELKENLLNLHNAVHGGVIYSLADIGMGVALFSLLEKDEKCLTIEIKINYLNPVYTGTLICAAKVIQKGKKIAVIESEIKNNDKLTAKAIGTFSIFKPKKQ
jgi:acyl-CoA thioesterase